jgi:protein-L-isoaspartate(D-aspartate) O-methyltransferase
MASVAHAQVHELSQSLDRYAEIRRQMVDYQVRARGVHDERVLAAMVALPRHPFVPASLRHRAYDDTPLPIGRNQTISQPYIVAATLEALDLRGDERVLEVGTGSGYQAALLGRLAREVVSVEIVRELAERATRAIAALDIGNVEVIHADGGLGWPARAPYDAIVMAAACTEVPKALWIQLAEGGRLIVPLGAGEDQTLVRVRRRGEAFEEERLFSCVFVPLTGVGASGH